MGENQYSWPGFHRVFMISATESDGVKDLRDYLLRSTSPGSWIYNEDVVTDQNPRELAIDTARECLLNTCRHSTPYDCKIQLARWEVDSLGILNVVMQITVKKNNEVIA